MRSHFPTKIPIRTLSHYKETNHFVAFIKRHPFLCDLILFFLTAGMIYGFIAYFSRFSEPLAPEVKINLSPWYLAKYTFFSMSRGLLGYILSLIFSLFWGFWAAKDRIAERALIPTLDILQSIPILGFMPGLILFLVNIYPTNNIGLELAAILMIFTSQAWNMTFSVYHSIRIIPQDKIECAVVYRLNIWQRVRWLEIPYTIISLVWNSIMSMAGGWFFLIVNESFKLGNRDFRLPGIGSYMSAATADGNILAMIWAIVAMLVLIVFLDSFLWKPLIAWSQKFRVEETGSINYTDSIFFQIITNSVLINKVHQVFHLLSHFRHRHACTGKGLNPLIISRTCLLILLFLIVVAFIFLVREIRFIAINQWLHLGHMALLTLGRVCGCMFLGTIIALPLGLWIGLSEKISKRLEPLLQVTASFPATLLFPILVLFFRRAGIPLNIGSIVLMLTGTLWYILFNVLAGAKAMPSDLKEVATIFQFNKWQRFGRLYFPAIFPYLITGLVTAAGGAWNASIVAEYVSYKNQIFTIPGLGSSINLSAQNGDIPMLVASILTMSVVVVTLNYQVWLRLYHFSEKRFSLNY